MELSELKLVSASNIIRLRTEAHMTQAELGAKLNYSDKTVSKWERGEAIPDAYVLTRLAQLFDVTVDYLLSSHDSWEAPVEEDEQMKKPRYSEWKIILLTTISVWTAFLTAFVALWIFGIVWWEIFALALPASLVELTVLLSVFRRKRYLSWCIGALVFSVLLLIFVVIPEMSWWQLLILTVPAELIVFLSFHLRVNSENTEKH